MLQKTRRFPGLRVNKLARQDAKCGDVLEKLPHGGAKECGETRQSAYWPWNLEKCGGGHRQRFGCDLAARSMGILHESKINCLILWRALYPGGVASESARAELDDSIVDSAPACGNAGRSRPSHAMLDNSPKSSRSAKNSCCGTLAF